MQMIVLYLWKHNNNNFCTDKQHFSLMSSTLFEHQPREGDRFTILFDEQNHWIVATCGDQEVHLAICGGRIDDVRCVLLEYAKCNTFHVQMFYTDVHENREIIISVVDGKLCFIPFSRNTKQGTTVVTTKGEMVTPYLLVASQKDSIMHKQKWISLDAKIDAQGNRKFMDELFDFDKCFCNISDIKNLPCNTTTSFGNLTVHGPARLCIVERIIQLHFGKKHIKKTAIKLESTGDELDVNFHENLLAFKFCEFDDNNGKWCSNYRASYCRYCPKHKCERCDDKKYYASGNILVKYCHLCHDKEVRRWHSFRRVCGIAAPCCCMSDKICDNCNDKSETHEHPLFFRT